jgi:DNA-binding MarR family transcriptional regulator
MVPTSAPIKARRGNAEGAERLRRVVARLGRALRLTHVDASMSPSQREVLNTIVRRGPLRLSELAAEEGLNPTMLSRIVGHLEAAKLVTRTPDAKDARVVHLAVTAEGSALHDEIKRERTEALMFALDQLTKDERQAVLTALPALERLDEKLRTRIQ